MGDDLTDKNAEGLLNPLNFISLGKHRLKHQNHYQNHSRRLKKVPTLNKKYSMLYKLCSQTWAASPSV